MTALPAMSAHEAGKVDDFTPCIALDKILFCLLRIVRLQTYLVLKMLQFIGAPTRVSLGGYCIESYYPIFSNVTSSPCFNPPFPSMVLA